MKIRKLSEKDYSIMLSQFNKLISSIKRPEFFLCDEEIIKRSAKYCFAAYDEKNPVAFVFALIG